MDRSSTATSGASGWGLELAGPCRNLRPGQNGVSYGGVAGGIVEGDSVRFQTSCDYQSGGARSIGVGGFNQGP